MGTARGRGGECAVLELRVVADRYVPDRLHLELRLDSLVQLRCSIALSNVRFGSV